MSVGKASKERKHSTAENDVVSAIEREQRQIGDELHDNVCQTLAGTSLLLETIGRAVAAGEPVSMEMFRELGRVLEAAIDQTRALSRRYRPVDLQDAGLMNALQELAAITPKTEFRCEKPVFVDNAHHALALYRVAQEALRNAVQHSTARKIRITLKQDKSSVLLKVKDDGKGFDAGNVHCDIAGLRIMACWAAAVGGELRVLSRKRLGTTITLKLPAPNDVR